MKAYDLAVIGGGPAGAAAALTAARNGLSVALFEPQVEADKPCGEGILPAGVAALRRLGLAGLLTRGVAIQRIRYVLASGRELEIPFCAPGCALPRPVLATALAQAIRAESGIDWHACRALTELCEDGVRLVSRDALWSARTLIVADGLQGTAGAWLRRPGSERGRYGLRARARAREPLERVEVHLGQTSEVYLTPLPEGLVNVAVLRDELPATHRESRAWLAAALEEHPRARALLGTWVTSPEARALSRARPRALAEAGTFLAGDAAGGVDPVLGCGVAIGLTTGLAAAEAAVRVVRGSGGHPERDYARFVRRETRLRRAVASGLKLLSAHPRLQESTAWVLGAWPSLATSLAGQVAGA